MDREDWLPGMPSSPAQIPELRYQVLGGRVYTKTRWADGSTARGEVELVVLDRLRGEPTTREGWYGAAGNYLGSDPAWES